MKNFRNYLILMLIVIPFIALGQDSGVDGLATPSLLTVVWKLALVTLAGSFSEAFKHLVARTFNIGIWWRDDARNAVIAFVITIILAVVDIYFEGFDMLIEQYTGQETDAYNYTGLAVVAALLSPFVKGILNIGKTRAKYAK